MGAEPAAVHRAEHLDVAQGIEAEAAGDAFLDELDEPRDANVRPGCLNEIKIHGRCDCDILLTNAGLSDSTAEDVETLFKSAGVKQVRSFGSTWICQQIVRTSAFVCWCPGYMVSAILVRFWTSGTTRRQKPFLLL
jgi:hypothetical protein